MSKKIIAVSLALLIMIVGLVGCTKKKDTTTINGKEYLIMTDENGDAVINDKNQAAALVTDHDGELVNGDDGEPQTYLVKIFDTLDENGYAYGEHYKLPVPDGWTVGRGNRILKDGTNEKTYIEFVFIKELEDDETIQDYIAKVDADSKQLADVFANDEAMDNLIKENPELAAYKGSKAELGTSSTMINGRGYTIRTYEIINADGKSIRYSEQYYFEDDGNIYCVQFISEEEVQKIEFLVYLQDFVFVP